MSVELDKYLQQNQNKCLHDSINMVSSIIPRYPKTIDIKIKIQVEAKSYSVGSNFPSTCSIFAAAFL